MKNVPIFHKAPWQIQGQKSHKTGSLTQVQFFRLLKSVLRKCIFNAGFIILLIFYTKIFQKRKRTQVLPPKNLVHYSKLDFCNSLLCGIPKHLLWKLQSIQNAAECFVTPSSKYDHITPLLMQLHWLPIARCIKFKNVLLTFKCLHDLSPFYIKELLIPYCPAQMLQSPSTLLLAWTDYNMRTYGTRAFATSTPELWNQLPKYIRAIDNLTTFKSKVKTYFLTMLLKTNLNLNFFFNVIFCKAHRAAVYALYECFIVMFFITIIIIIIFYFTAEIWNKFMLLWPTACPF